MDGLTTICRPRSVSVRYSFSEGENLNPISIRGSDLPGFPVQDDLQTHSASISYMRLVSPLTVHSARAAFFRHIFDFDQRLNKTPPSAFGFQYDSASELGQGPPFFNVNGYSPIGGAITGPRISTQNTYELYDSLSHTSGQHSWKFGGEFRRMQINAYQAIAPNAFFVFAPSFPTNDAFANLLLGRPVVFYQGLGDLSRGLRNWDLALFLQDEWRVSRKLTLNYGLRHETITPFADIRDRMNAFVPGQQSTVRPDAPRGLLFPGDEGIGRGIAPVFGKRSCRASGSPGIRRDAAHFPFAGPTQFSSILSRTVRAWRFKRLSAHSPGHSSTSTVAQH